MLFFFSPAYTIKFVLPDVEKDLDNSDKAKKKKCVDINFFGG